MTGGRARKLEQVVDAASSGLLMFAVLAAAQKTGFPPVPDLALASVGGFLCWRMLSSIGPNRRDLHLQPFGVVPLPGFLADEELVLTHAQRISSPAELVLDDLAAHLGADSRVVRLFDPAAMPTAGGLAARIDRGLDRLNVQSAPPDASQALFDALAELRRSLR
jgi:hypothetical protein